MHEGELFETVLPGNVVRVNLLPNLDGQGVLRMEKLSKGHRDYVDRNRNCLARVRLNSVIIEWNNSSIMLSSGDAQETLSIPRHLRVLSHSVFRDDSSQRWMENNILFSKYDSPFAHVFNARIAPQEPSENVVEYIFKKVMKRTEIKKIEFNCVSDHGVRMFLKAVQEENRDLYATDELAFIHRADRTTFRAKPTETGVMLLLESLPRLRTLEVWPETIVGRLTAKMFNTTAFKNLETLIIGAFDGCKMDSEHIETDFGDEHLLSSKLQECIVNNCIVTPAGINQFLREVRLGVRDFRIGSPVDKFARASAQKEDAWRRWIVRIEACAVPPKTRSIFKSRHFPYDSIYANTQQPDFAIAKPNNANHLWMQMRKDELRGRPRTGFMSRQRDLLPDMRAFLVDWLVDVTQEFGLKRETLHLTVSLVDRFLSQKEVPRDRLQLFGIASISIAAKFGENSPIELRKLVDICCDIYTEEEMFHVENLILSTLNFDFDIPLRVTSEWFATLLLSTADAQKETRHYTFFILELVLLDAELVASSPSKTAAAAVYLAHVVTGREPWTAALSSFTGFTRAEVIENALVLEPAIKALRKSVHQAVMSRYADARFSAVSTLAEPILSITTQHRHRHQPRPQSARNIFNSMT